MLLQQFDLVNYRDIYKKYPFQHDIKLNQVKNKTQAKQFAKFGNLVVAQNCKEKFLLIPYTRRDKPQLSAYRYVNGNYKYYDSSVSDIFNLIQGDFSYYMSEDFRTARKSEEKPIIDHSDFQKMYLDQIQPLVKTAVKKLIKKVKSDARKDLTANRFEKLKKKIKRLEDYSDENEMNSYVNDFLIDVLAKHLKKNYLVPLTTRHGRWSYKIGGYHDYQEPSKWELNDFLLKKQKGLPNDKYMDLLYTIINGACREAWTTIIKDGILKK